jgi:cobalamin biosynthesis protein CbiG
MPKTVQKKKGDSLVKTIEKKYGVDLGYSSDAELHTDLKKSGVPSLSKLLKLTRSGK